MTFTAHTDRTLIRRAGFCIAGLTLAALTASAGDRYGCLDARLDWLEWRFGADEAERTIAHYDADTGRSLLNFPPDRVVDYDHMRLEIDIPDMNTPTFTATQRLTFSPIGKPAGELRLNAVLLEIASVEATGRQATFEHDGEFLTVRFDPPVGIEERCELTIAYTAEDPPDGLFWTPESPEWPGRPAQIHTQGQPETNRYWFPSHDFPNERLTTELIVTVQKAYEVSSNGKLMSRRNDAGRTTFRWLQTPNHTTYLVSLIVGQFDIVELGTEDLPAPVYVPRGRAGDVEHTYGNTMEMLEVFEELLDEPYPWDRYAQLVVWNFGAGGMENTSATTMFDTAIFAADSIEDHDLDGLIAHELAHQWFGDLLTCKSWQHIWINEGWATYMESLWLEHRDGREGYDADTLINFARVTDRDTPEWPYKQPMASRQYNHPWEVFRRDANPYPKGASVLHMLRRKLGDEVFFKGVRAYVDEHKLTAVETSDFRMALEEASGESLERFFHQWVFRPGVPTLDIDVEWKAGVLTLSATQTQNIDADNPAFWIDLPVQVTGALSGAVTELVFSTDEREKTMEFEMGEPPTMVVIDPDLHVLASMTINQPAGRWLRQLVNGPTPASKIQAARHLVDTGGPDAAALLERTAMDPDAARKLRREAVLALGERNDIPALARLTGVGLDDAYVRADLVNAGKGAAERARDAGDETQFEAAAAVVVMSEQDPTSELVRDEALKAIGELGLTDELPRLLAATEVESQHDRVRQAALEAIGNLGDARGFDVAARYAQFGSLSRTRPKAIEALAKLAEHDRDRAFGIIAGIYDSDREKRALRAAGQALVDLADPRGLKRLEARATGDRDRLERERAEDLLAELRAAIEDPSGAAE
ncbi:MAG: M1 family aminopeptidase [Planctomycetota bacterium]